MGIFSKIGGFFGASTKGKDMSAEDSAQEDTTQAALDKLVTGPKAFGNRTMSAGDAEEALRKQGALPAGWRLRESDSTSSGYRPTKAATKVQAIVRAGQIAAAVGTGGASLGVQAAINGGLGAAQGAMGGGGIKGALLGGAIGAGGSFIPGAGSTLAKRMIGQAGMGAGTNLAQGGDWKSALISGGLGAAGAGLGKVAPALTKSGLGQKAINMGIDTGLTTARTGKFDPLRTALSAGNTFSPDAARSLTGNGMGQRAINFGSNQLLNLAGGGKFNPVEAGMGAVGVINPRTGAKLRDYLPGRAAGGPVEPDKPYVVGEEGPEVVVPKAPGTVLPNPASAAPGAPAAPVAPAGAAAAPAPKGPAAADAPPVPPTFGQRWGPVVAQGLGAVGGIYAARNAQQNALQRTPDEQAAMTGAMSAGKGAEQTANSLMMESRPYISKPASYYQTLLNGNRAAMAQAVAPERAALNESYRGAQTQLASSGIRGAARDVIAGNMNRDRSAKVSGLTTGVQPAAAAALANLGQGLQQTAGPLYGTSGSIYSQLLNNGLLNRQFAAKEGTETGKSVGGLLSDLGTLSFGKGKTPATPGKTKPGQPGGTQPTVPYIESTMPPEFPDEEGGGEVGSPPPMPPTDTGDYGGDGDVDYNGFPYDWTQPQG